MARAYTLKRRAESREATRSRIVEAAIELHQTIGPSATTVTDIAERAGVGRVTVYRHFPDEAALAWACSGLYLQRNPPPDEEAWRAIADPGERLRAAGRRGRRRALLRGGIAVALSFDSVAHAGARAGADRGAGGRGRPAAGRRGRMTGERAGRLISLNVGLPRDVVWQGRTVHTGIWKHPVDGPRMVRRLNVDGDGQGDLAGHGGEQRAVFVYQLDSYRYWERELGRDDFELRPVRRELHRRGPGRRRGLHRRPLPDRRRRVRGDPAAGHLLPRRHPHGRPAHPGAARLAPPPRLLPPRAPRGRGAGGRRDRQARLRPGGDDGRRGRRPALPARPPAPTAAPARAADPGAQPRVAGVVPRPARGGRRRRQRRAVGGEPRRRPGRGSARSPSSRSTGRATRSCRCASPTPRARRCRRPIPASTSPCAFEPEPGGRSLLRNYSLSGPPGADDYRISVKREPHGAGQRLPARAPARRRPARGRRAARHLHPQADDGRPCC